MTVTRSSSWSLIYDTEAMVATRTVTENGEVVERTQYPLERRPEGWEPCRVYWGSHGCDLERGHDGHCECCCCCDGEHEGGGSCVGMHPYYGPETRFYGEDVGARGLPQHEDE